MDINQLEVLVTVARERSFSRAAEVLGRTQPAISQAIRRLEAEVGERLFDRSSKDGTLTFAGEILVEQRLHIALEHLERDDHLAAPCPDRRQHGRLGRVRGRVVVLLAEVDHVGFRRDVDQSSVGGMISFGSDSDMVFSTPSVVARGAVDGRANGLAGNSRLVRRPVAVHAPAHAQVRNLADPLHRLDRSVACLALDAGAHVGAVVEVDEVGQVVHPDPPDWRSSAASHGLQRFVEGERVVELAKFRRDDRAGRAALACRLLLFFPHGAQRRGDVAVAVHADAGGRHARVAPLRCVRVAVEARDL